MNGRIEVIFVLHLCPVAFIMEPLSEKYKEKELPNYNGLIRTSIHARILDHLKGQKRQYTGNLLHGYNVSERNGHHQQYICIPIASEMKIIRLNVNEELHIEKQDRTASLNNKMECRRGGLVRITATRVIN